MAEEQEHLVAFTDENEVDMDYLDMESPEPEPLEFYSHHHDTRDSESNLSPVAMGDDVKSSELEDMSPPHAGASASARRTSYTMNTQTQTLIKQFRATIGELERDLNESRDANEKLLVEKETIIISYDSKIDELNFEIDEMQIESQQYQLRYSEINEELHELRSSQAENVSSGKENQELLMRLQNKEQNEMDLMIDLESANKQIERLKNQTKDSNENTGKLQKMLISIKKEKTILEKNLQSVIDKYDILSKQYRLEINGLTDRMAQLQRENEIYRQNLSSAEQERQEMQNNFTEATLELLHDEINETHGDLQQEESAMRLARISSTDMNRKYSEYDEHHRNDSMLEPDSPMPTASFVKQRFGSQTSLPDESLLQSLHSDAEYMQLHHSRKSSNISVDSRMGGGYDAVDPIKLKQDIREVVSEVMVSDIKTIIRQEMVAGARGASEEESNQKLALKIDELVKITQDRRKKSVDLDLVREAEEEEQQRLNGMIREFEASMTDILEKQVIESIVSSKKERKAFEDAMTTKIGILQENVQNTEAINDCLKETIQNQMTVFQIALENEIGSSVAQSMQHVVKDKIDGKLRENIRVDMTECLDSIREMMIVAPPPQAPQKEEEETDDGSVKAMIEETLNNVMSGKIDGFMDEFRKEVIPEVEAVFAQLSNMQNNVDSNADADDEKANSNRNELILLNERLQSEIEMLRAEKSEHERVLRSAATSKVHQVVKLQNLLDHMRNDNRLLQYKLERYQEKFQQIKQHRLREEESNLNLNLNLNVGRGLNKMWGYFGGGGTASSSNNNNYNNNSNVASHLST